MQLIVLFSIIHSLNVFKKYLFVFKFTACNFIYFENYLFLTRYFILNETKDNNIAHDKNFVFAILFFIYQFLI